MGVIGGFDHIQRGTERRATSTPPRGFSLQQREDIFKQMVAGELEDGLLRYSRRRRLIKFAKRLGFAPFQASLLIAEAQHPGRSAPLCEVDVDAEPSPVAAGHDRAVWIKLILALLAAVALDLAAINWLLRD